MTRQVAYVFFGYWRGHDHAHESPSVMVAPMAILAFFAIALGAIGTPAWPWFRAFLGNRVATLDAHTFAELGLSHAARHFVRRRLPRHRLGLVALRQQVPGP